MYATPFLDLPALASVAGTVRLPGSKSISNRVLLLAAHISRSVTMTEWLDPSILDEARPFERDVSLNLYDPGFPETAPYSPEFVRRFRQAHRPSVRG